MPRRRARARRRRRSTAGITRIDKEPQILQLAIQPTAGWKSTKVEVPLFNIFGQIGKGGSGKAICLEILQVDFQSDTGAQEDPTAFFIGARDLNDSTETISALYSDRSFFSTWNSGALTFNQLDYTDEAGHGLLYPSQAIFVNAQSASLTPPTWSVRIMYRIVSVGLSEYIGLVNQYLVTAS